MEDKNAFSNDSYLKNLIYAKNVNAKEKAVAKTPTGFFRIAVWVVYITNVNTINRNKHKPYFNDLLTFSGMDSKNPFVCVGVAGVAGVAGGDTFPNNKDNPFIRNLRNQTQFNKIKIGKITKKTIIHTKFKKKLLSSQATNQLKNAVDFVFQSSKLLISNISNNEEVESTTFLPDESSDVLTEFKLNIMKMITIKKNAINASKSLIRRI
jgi:hypothetical protein